MVQRQSSQVWVNWCVFSCLLNMGIRALFSGPDRLIGAFARLKGRRLEPSRLSAAHPPSPSQHVPAAITGRLESVFPAGIRAHVIPLMRRRRGSAGRLPPQRPLCSRPRGLKSSTQINPPPSPASAAVSRTDIRSVWCHRFKKIKAGKKKRK